MYVSDMYLIRIYESVYLYVAVVQSLNVIRVSALRVFSERWVQFTKVSVSNDTEQNAHRSWFHAPSAVVNACDIQLHIPKTDKGIGKIAYDN